MQRFDIDQAVRALYRGMVIPESMRLSRGVYRRMHLTIPTLFTFGRLDTRFNEPLIRRLCANPARFADDVEFDDARDLALASVAIGVELPAAFLDDGWLWAIRLEQILADERDEPWVAWVATRDGAVVGHTGFHARPDADGEVEVSYTVLPALRGRGVGAEEVLGLPARRGIPRNVGGLVDVVKTPGFATGVGLVHYGTRHQRTHRPRAQADKGMWKKVRGWFGEIF